MRLGVVPFPPYMSLFRGELCFGRLGWRLAVWVFFEEGLRFASGAPLCFARFRRGFFVVLGCFVFVSLRVSGAL